MPVRYRRDGEERGDEIVLRVAPIPPSSPSRLRVSSAYCLADLLGMDRP